ncbi:MAG: F0F1 ATP synthase subunit delta [Candidatus Roizmanbacteria bacterium]
MKLTPALRQDLKNFLKSRLTDQSVLAQVYAPYELTSDEVEKIKGRYPLLASATISTHIDLSLIAGFVIEVGSQRIDCSVKSRIDTIFA